MPASRRHLSIVPDPAPLVSDAGGFILRVELDEITPSIWRRLHVRATIPLDDLHLAIQAAMGWDNHHLHQWRTRSAPNDRNLPTYKPTYAFADWETDEDERDEAGVPLTTLLHNVGDRLGYEYDFGDSWDHTITVEGVTEDTGATRCLDGARACPPEDIGGTPGYATLLEVKADPKHEYRDWLGEHADVFDPEAFDVDAVNRRITSEAHAAEIFRTAKANSPLVSSIAERLFPQSVPDFTAALGAARLDEPVTVPDDAAAFLAPFAALVHASIGGIKLTQAGYLPPVVVAELRELIPDTIGESNREIDHYQVSMLREYARSMGLTRVYKGTYVTTKIGARCAEDPILLWDTITRKIPFDKDDADRELAIIELVQIAAGILDRGPLAHETMTALKWRKTNGGNMGDDYSELRRLFTMLGVERLSRWKKLPTPPISDTARMFARTALLHS